MELADLALAFLRWFAPPKESTPPKILGYAKRIALVACVTFVGSIVLWTWYFHDHYPTVATKSEMIDGDKELQNEIGQVLATMNHAEAERLRGRIVDLDLARCGMHRGSAQRAMYDNELDKAVANYQRLAEDPNYAAMPCSGL